MPEITPDPDTGTGRPVRLPPLQHDVLSAVADRNPIATTDGQVPGTYRTGGVVHRTLLRLQERGLVTAELDRGRCHWWTTEEGLSALGRTQ
jgi:hypothetical protein